jgi:hypothetical protein
MFPSQVRMRFFNAVVHKATHMQQTSFSRILKRGWVKNIQIVMDTNNINGNERSQRDKSINRGDIRLPMRYNLCRNNGYCEHACHSVIISYVH